MKPLPIVGGSIVHSRGVLPLKLTGAARAQAHADILAFAHPENKHSPKHPVYVESIATIARHDPSLLLEPIPKQCPIPVEGNKSWATSDATWENQNRWHATWLGRFSDPLESALPVVEVALQAGVHPDDPGAWPEGGLLKPDCHSLFPDLLALALKHGASPDAGRGWYDSYLWKALDFARTNMPNCDKEAGLNEVRGSLRNAEMLLDAGVTEIDPPPGPLPLRERGVKALNNRNTTSIGMIASLHGHGWLVPEVSERLLEIVRQLHSRGADIDRPNGNYGEPPIVQAVRAGNIALASLLIELGCRIDDDHIVRPGERFEEIAPLMQEARKVKGESFVASLTQALMNRQIGNASGHAAGAYPRRPRMVL